MRVHFIACLAIAGTVCCVGLQNPLFVPGAAVASERPAKAKQAHRKHRPRVRRYGRLSSAHRRHVRRFARRGRIIGLGLPAQTLFPPYYRSNRPYGRGPHVPRVIRGGLTAEQGSRWRGRFEGGPTVEYGSRWAGDLRGGPTAQQGSRWRSRIPPGRTVEQGSRWASRIPNWTFSGTRAPMRPKGIPYYRTHRPAWAYGIRW